MFCRKRLVASAAGLIATTILSPYSAQAAECTPEVITNGNVTVVAFKSVGTCTWTTPTATTTFRGLIIGGGGGGGSFSGGGGGGGGLVEFESLTATDDIFTVIVGGGGSGSTDLNNAGNSGSASTLSGTSISLTARGGAGGGSFTNNSNAPARANGGSGGGAAQGGTSSVGGPNSNGTQTAQTQTPDLSVISGNQFGFNGGTRSTLAASGGGGSGANGVSGGAGGAGRANSILGVSYIWAGGGGGGQSTGGNAGGTGGGGGGGAYTPNNFIGGAGGTGGINAGSQGQSGCAGGAGGANTGGGGGGGQNCGGTSRGGAGGSGILILSYLRVTSPASISLQLSTGLQSAEYRITSTIEAIVPTNGKVSFYQFGKPIAGCTRKGTTGSSPNIKATCTWRPSMRGSVALSALFTPTNINFSNSRVEYFPIAVTNRGTRR